MVRTSTVWRRWRLCSKLRLDVASVRARVVPRGRRSRMMMGRPLPVRRRKLVLLLSITVRLLWLLLIIRGRSRLLIVTHLVMRTLRLLLLLLLLRLGCSRWKRLIVELWLIVLIRRRRIATATPARSVSSGAVMIEGILLLGRWLLR